ncbi:MAG: hypothetical protein P4L83_06835 [Nevskia sp.]|nr:hypothetical protein [Nevskia sp.]
MTIRLLIPVLSLLVLLAACATPETRIKDNPNVYANLSAEQQALVKKGEVGIGMPQAAVDLALGKPDRVTEHTDADGTREVWHYTQLEYWGPPITGQYWYPYPYIYDPAFVIYPGFYSPGLGQVERDRLRVVFDKDRKVVAIEREK